MTLRILVVDDEENWRNQFIDLLENWKYEVHAMKGFDGAEGLLRHTRYDLALLDICLDLSDPCYISFQKFCMFLKENCVDLPILAVSGEKIEPKFMFNLREKYGVADFVSKNNLSLPDLKERIKALIHSRDVVTILFLAADPTDATRLRLGEEFREINEQIRLAKLRNHFRMELPQLSVRTKDISGALLSIQPRIVHFSGHGTYNGELCFENPVGQTQFVLPDALAALFEQFANQIDCVILNACYSEKQATAIAEYVSYVVGMNKAIGDKAAIAFAIGFYQALGAGRTIKDAFELGCVQIRLQGISEHLTPILIEKALTQP